MTSKALLLTYCPPVRSPRAAELVSSRTSKRLAQVFEMDVRGLAERFDWEPLLGEWPGPDPHPSRPHSTAWRAPQRQECRARAEAMAPSLADRPAVLLLGRPVREAFLPWIGEQPRLLAPIATLGTFLIPWPSPSSVSRWWLEPQNVERAAEAAARLLTALEAPSGAQRVA